MIKTYTIENFKEVSVMTTFNDYFTMVDPAYKASFYNEFVHVWGLDKTDYMEESFFVELLNEIQKNNYIKQGF